MYFTAFISHCSSDHHSLFCKQHFLPQNLQGWKRCSWSSSPTDNLPPPQSPQNYFLISSKNLIWHILRPFSLVLPPETVHLKHGSCSQFDLVLTRWISYVIKFLLCIIQSLGTPVSPFSPRPTLREQVQLGCSPLSQRGCVLAAQLFQHAIVPQVLLPSLPAERFHKVLLKDQCKQIQHWIHSDLGKRFSKNSHQTWRNEKGLARKHSEILR